MVLTAVVAVAQIRDAVGNEYGRPQDVAGEQRTVFTSHADAAFDVCFENLLTGCTLSAALHPPMLATTACTAMGEDDYFY
jgi:hypothetical protein